MTVEHLPSGEGEVLRGIQPTFPPVFQRHGAKMTKPKRTCSIDGCSKACRARGWCNAHYWRFRKHGNPLGGRTYLGELPAFLDEVVANFDGDECLIWPFAATSKGYGKIRINGKSHVVTRVVCEREHGPAPTSRHQAAHSCGKGHEGCCNRHHLEWKTPEENQADRLIHGTSSRGERHGRAKLTEEQVLEIRASTGLYRELAEKYGIDQRSVRGIKLGEKWAWLVGAANDIDGGRSAQ